MAVNVIAMLTNNDLTVPDAHRIFAENKHAKTKCWGFKDTGISQKDAEALVANMKEAGKTVFLEPLKEDEESMRAAAKLAVECGFDSVIGMVYDPAVQETLASAGIQYYPTCGRREGIPRMLLGTIEEIIEDANCLLEKGVEGICLSSYRYIDGDPEEMTRRFIKEVNAPLIISGGINGYARLDFVKEAAPGGFTIGSALFAHKFGEDKTIAEQLDIIQDYLK